MTRRTIIALIILAAILGGIFLIRALIKKGDDSGAGSAVLSVSAYNQTKNQDATKVAANSKDVVVYTLTAENPTDKIISGFVFEAGIGDITKSVTLIDAQAASYNSENNSLVWTPLDIPSMGSIEKKFTVRVNDELPADPDMVIRFNNEVRVVVSKSTVAGANTTGSQPGTDYAAPKTGIPFSISLVLALAITLGLFLFNVAKRMGRIA